MRPATVFFWQSKKKAIKEIKTDSRCKCCQRKKKWGTKAKILLPGVFLYENNQKPAVYRKEKDFPEKTGWTEKIQKKIALLPALSIMEKMAGIQNCLYNPVQLSKDSEPRQNSPRDTTEKKKLAGTAL